MVENKNEKIKKTYRFRTKRIEELQKILIHKNGEMQDTVYNETDIIEQAIHNYYSYIFGAEERENVKKELGDIVLNNITPIFKMYFEQFAKALNNLNYNDKILEESVFAILKSSGAINRDVQQVPIIVNAKSMYEEPIKQKVKELIENE